MGVPSHRCRVAAPAFPQTLSAEFDLANFETFLTMTPQEFQAIYPHVIGWIRQTLAACANQAETVASQGFPRLPLYFNPELLASTKFVRVERVPVPPLSQLGLTRFAAFEQGNYDGITYLDTFFVTRHRANDEGLSFHELIHVVQWQLLGPERFLAVYAAGLESCGYRNSPLEVMAYNAEADFRQSVKPFNAEILVAEQLRLMPAT